MFDMHYDLLTTAYIAYLKKDFTAFKKWCKAYNDSNIKGVIANLYFANKEEMIQELHPKYYQENVSIIEMFKIAKQLVETFLPNTEVIYSIEGCDYLEIEDLEKLYHLGLRSILPVRNEKNKYASGSKSDMGLTEKGKRLLDKAIALKIAIDLSHTNEKSFYDIVDYIKENQKEEDVIIYASHSNAKSLCNRDRNLTDEQLKRLKEVNGIVGVFSNRNFIVPQEERYKVTEQEKKDYYLKHINHIVNIVGIDYVGVATDDMNFCKEVDPEYGELSIYNYDNINFELVKTLSKIYNKKEINKIMYQNMKNNYNKLVYNKKKTIRGGKNMKHLENEKDFNELIAKGTVLVDFYADWCGPCQMIGPILEEIAKEKEDITVIKVNVDNFENIAREYKVLSIPTLIVFKDGKLTKQEVGYIEKNRILELLKD